MADPRQDGSETVRSLTRSARMVVLFLVSLGLAMAGLLVVGLPGAVVLWAAAPLAGWFSPARLGGDQVWPAALAISALGPFALLPADVVSRRAKLGRGAAVLLTTGLALLINVAVSAVGIVLGAG